MVESAPKNMVKKKSFQNNWMRMSGAILFATLLIPTPAQALCNGSESCGILGGFLLSIITVPISLMALFLAIWPATRKSLQAIAALPGGMAALTTYLIIQAQRLDLAFIPLIHIGLMALMIFLGRIDSKREETQIQP
ncbi:MAG: hypothetical protein HN444_02340 [Euryarchaeota archaeon]|nr:hypothetical protein [Euryarchaeota archaeon]